MKLQKLINKFIWLLVGCIILATLLYIIHFYHNTISQDPLSWGVFGDFIGGVINPLIGIISLYILGKLTVIMGNKTNEENKKLFKLQEQIRAYNEIVTHIEIINSLPDKYIFIKKKKDFMVSIIPLNQQGQYDLQIVTEMLELDSIMVNFYHSLNTFETKFGLSFEYNFSSKEHIDLINDAKKICEIFSPIKLGDVHLGDAEIQLFNKFSKEFMKFIENLKSEIKTLQTNGKALA